MRAVIYARYSSDNQREASIEGQLRECMEFATYNDIQVIDNYIDRAMSARTDNQALRTCLPALTVILNAVKNLGKCRS